MAGPFVALKKVKSWHAVGEEEALGMDIRNYEQWKNFTGSREE